MKTKRFFLLLCAIFISMIVTAQSTQCLGTTKAGTRCKNKTTNVSGYCYQHESQNKGAVNVLKTETKTTEKSETVKKDTTTVVNKSDSPTTRRTISVQCSGTTKAGTRCKHMTYSPNGRCYQHGGN